MVSALFRWPRSMSIHLFSSGFFPQQVTVRSSQCFLRVSALLLRLSGLSPWVIASALFPCSLPLSPVLLVGHCVRLVSLLFPFFSLLVSLLVSHCLCLVSLLSPFVSGLGSFLLVTALRPCLPSVPFCVPSCLPSCWSLCPFLLFPFLSPFLLVIASALSSFLPAFVSSLVCSCWSLCPSAFPPSVRLSPFVSLLVGHCVTCPSCLPSVFFCLPSCWLSVIVSVLFLFCFLLSPFFVSHCVRFVFLLVSHVSKKLTWECFFVVSPVRGLRRRNLSPVASFFEAKQLHFTYVSGRC